MNPAKAAAILALAAAIMDAARLAASLGQAITPAPRLMALTGLEAATPLLASAAPSLGAALAAAATILHLDTLLALGALHDAALAAATATATALYIHAAAKKTS